MVGQRETQADAKAGRKVVRGYDMRDRAVEVIGIDDIDFLAIEVRGAVGSKLLGHADKKSAARLTTRIAGAVNGAQFARRRPRDGQSQEEKRDTAFQSE